jgi:serine/threonine-protein kinase
VSGVRAPAPASAPARRWIVVGLVALGLVGARVIAGIGGSSSPPAASSIAPASASASGAWIDPPPVSSNAEAVALYNDALRRYHDRSGGGNLRMLKASQLDQELAAAPYMQLLGRGLATDIGAGRRIFARAATGRDKLPPRDRAVLDAIEPIFRRDPADYRAAASRMDDVAQRYRDDPFVLFAQSQTHGLADRGDQIAILERAVALAPKEAWLASFLADERRDAGDFEGASRELARCIEISPVAAMCIESRIDVEVLTRNCAAMEADARRWAVIRPDSASPYLLLTPALVALGRPIEAARETARQAELLTFEGADERRVLWKRTRAALESAGGDFVEAERRLLELAKIVEPSRSEYEHAIVALELAETYSEMGDDARAAKVAAAFVHKHDAWEPLPLGNAFAPDLDATGALLHYAAHGAIAAPEAVRLRDARIDWWRARASTVDGGAMWRAFFVAGVTTEAEASAAFAARAQWLDGGALAAEVADHAYVAIATVLAGKVDEAIPLLERQAATCKPLDAIVPATRARFQLGRAREAKGDVAGACAEYARVLARWGSAKPKSVTADAARARMRALACK